MKNCCIPKVILPKECVDKQQDSNIKGLYLLTKTNHIYVPFDRNVMITRNSVPKEFKRKGIWITYLKEDKQIVTEWYIDNNADIDTCHFADDNNWQSLYKYILDIWETNGGVDQDVLSQIVKTHVDNWLSQNIADIVKEYIDYDMLAQIVNDWLKQYDIEALVKNYVDAYVKGDEFAEVVNNIAGDLINNYLTENLEPIVGEYFNAIVEYLRDNERVIANALARHEQAITDLQNIDAT